MFSQEELREKGDFVISVVDATFSQELITLRPRHIRNTAAVKLMGLTFMEWAVGCYKGKSH